ncbi:uncharacterized protein N7484_006303 [Penicillium longicatenatum]|uniref:uncharacterized protein n=1 Tax=Penicillium longicatenatum TaxID=1561947 RepID=UPI0025487FA1|nr:uncharacterized protein N7484_006303 [Penicillium longicatenatum]KAJ5643796.1 hypothetical protein N7484_006303 [Penicillium longicatenatum]
MLSSGHPCLRRRLSAVLDTVAAGPEDPLLFLYPRWAASALQQRRPIASLTPAAAPIKGNRAPSNSLRATIPSYASPSSFHPQTTRWSSADATSRSPNSFAPNLSTPAKDSASLPGDGADRDATESSHDIMGFPVGLSRESNGFLETASDVSESHRRRGNLSRRELRQKRLTGQRQAADHTHETEPGTEFKSRKILISKLSVRDRRKLRYGDYVRRTRGQGLFGGSMDGWNDMKVLLEEVQNDPRTEPKKSTRSKELQIPEETVALLAGIMDTSMKENIWYVHVRNGCKVQILHPREGDGANRKAILTGSEHVMELVEARIRSAQTAQDSGDPLADIRKPPVPMFMEREVLSRKNIPAPLIRGVWSWQRHAEVPLTLKDVLALRSSLTSVKEFAERVEDLTSARGPPTLGALASRNQKWAPHANQISRLLLDLFRHGQQIISTAALNRALEYLCEHEQLNAARYVFLKAEHVATVDTYNVLLRSAARRHDTWAFRKFLNLMPRANIRPNPNTWLALLSALTTSNAKASLITHMVQNGFMTDVKVIRTALQLTIQDSLLVHLESGQDVESFVALMEKTHGAGWFSSSLLGQMVSVAARCQNFAAVDALLKICAEQSFEVDSSILNQILPMCRANILTALHYTYECAKFPSFRFVPQIWERLFLIAFKSQHYNICRVLWRYACMDGSVTSDMRKTVLGSLTRNASYKKGNQMSEIWRLDAGKIIVGMDVHFEDYRIRKSVLKNVPSEFHDMPLSFLSSGYKPHGEDRLHQLQVAKYLVDRDIRYGASTYEPINSVSIMLQAAAVIDREWKGIPRPLTWRLQNAIHVPIRRNQNWHQKI